ncbi:PGAP3 factor, partial [Pseudoatta argentina]
MSKIIWILLLILHVCFIGNTIGSLGDRSQVYKQCLALCRNNNCRDDIILIEYILLLCSILISIMYQYYIKYNYNYKFGYWKLALYYWPFIRLFGCQEPASVLFSILNLCAHWIMYRKFKRRIDQTNPMFYAWTYFNIICLNGWFWSTVFHSRDWSFTEAMDYSCAFSMVLTLLYCMLLRITNKGTKTFIIITCGYVSILCTHLSHLWSGRINYGYNMMLNVAIGLATVMITMLWWYLNRIKLPYVYLIAWFNILTTFVTLLELADFPPIFWIFDAHSLWHASTVPLTVLLYRFVIADCCYLEKYCNKSFLDIDRHRQ